MLEDQAIFVTEPVTLWAVLDPISHLPLFDRATAGLDAAERGSCRKSDPSGSDRNSSGLDPAVPPPGSAPVQVPPVARRACSRTTRSARCGRERPRCRSRGRVAAGRSGLAAVAVRRRAAALCRGAPGGSQGQQAGSQHRRACAHGWPLPPVRQKINQDFHRGPPGPRIRLNTEQCSLLCSISASRGRPMRDPQACPLLPADPGPTAPAGARPPQSSRDLCPKPASRVPPGGFVRNLHPRSTGGQIPPGAPHDRSRRPSATEAARRLRDGSLSATALTEALLDRIAAREPVLRAFVLSIRRSPCGRRRRPMPGPGGTGGPAAWARLRGEGRAGYRRPAFPVRLAHLGRAPAAQRCRLRRARPPGRRHDSRQDGHDGIRHPAPGADQQPAQPAAYAGRSVPPARRPGRRRGFSMPVSAPRPPAASSARRPIAARSASSRPTARCTGRG